MKNIPYQKRPLFIVCAILVFLLLIVIISFTSRMKNYDEILDADAMNVYRNGSFVGTFVEPRGIMDTYNGSVGVGVIDISKLNLKKSDFIELYTLEFVKSNKVISTIEMLAPQLKDGSNKKTVADYFREFNGEYVVMYEDGYFFIFGQQFYDNLSGYFDQLFA